MFRTEAGEPRIYAVVTHDPLLGVISDFWVGDFTDEEGFRAVLAYVAECFEGGGYRYWLADLRFLSTGFAASHRWLIDEMVPRVVAAGLKREAVVLPERRPGLPPAYDVFGDALAALNEIGDARIRGFTDLEEAKRWLLAPEQDGEAISNGT